MIQAHPRKRRKVIASAKCPKCKKLRNIVRKYAPGELSRTCRGCSKKGQKAWNKGTKGLMGNAGKSVISQENLKMGNKAMFKGDRVGYDGLHTWVRRHKGVKHVCEWCSTEGYTEMANLDFNYTRDLETWAELCGKCHYKYDKANGWGNGKKHYKKLLEQRLAKYVSTKTRPQS